MQNIMMGQTWDRFLIPKRRKDGVTGQKQDQNIVKQIPLDLEV